MPPLAVSCRLSLLLPTHPLLNQRHHILQRHIRLYGDAVAENVAAVPAELAFELSRLAAYVFRYAAGQEVLGAYAAAECEMTPEFTFQRVDIHAFGLNGMEDVAAQVDQVADDRVDSAVGMVEHDAAAALRELVYPCHMGLYEAPPGFRGHHHRLLHPVIVAQRDPVEIETVEEDFHGSYGVIGDFFEKLPDKCGIENEVHEEVLEPAHERRPLEEPSRPDDGEALTVLRTPVSEILETVGDRAVGECVG